MLLEKSKQTMHSVTKKVKANDAYYLYQNKTKGCIKLLAKSSQTMHAVIEEITPNDA